MAAFLYEFEWDTHKAETNFKKHKLDFGRASTVFLDPFALTIPDEDHSETEPRWITLGKEQTGGYVVVVHTLIQLSVNQGRIRLISARKPTKAEIRNYEEQ